MGRKKALEKRLQRLQTRKQNLVNRSQAADVTVEELRSINAQITELNEDIEDVQEEIRAIDGEGGADPQPPTPEQRGAEPQPQNPPAGAEHRGFTPVAGFPQGGAQQEEPFAGREYRMAFMRYVQRGTPIPQDVYTRAAGDEGTTLAAELGMIIPTTIMNEFIKEVGKVYGQLYSKVRKLNIKGGVKFPISKLGAKFTWITETTVSGKQKAGDINEYIEFSYNIGEIRVAESLLAQVITLDLFESEIVKIMVEAYVEAMDKGIVAGTGNGQLLGITKDPRVKNVVTMTADEFADWTAWRKKLFAKIPLSKRGQGEFVFTAATVESNLLTMKDANNRPLFREATHGAVGEAATGGSFYGREVTMVEPDIVADFDTAASGDIVGIYWVPKDYAINTNLRFGMKRYFDEDTNEWINKGLTIVDGKIVDPSGCYLIRKA